MSPKLSLIPRMHAVALAAGFALAVTAAFGQTTTAPLKGEAATVKKLLEEKFPGAGIAHITKTNYAGLYEAMFDDKLIYTDAKVSYIIIGSIYDTATKTNVTEARMRKLNRVAVDKLPLDLAFVRVKGNGARKLVIFSDADCPFCHRLEDEMKGLNNVTIYTFLFPIDQLHPDSAGKSKKIWCAPDKVTAWTEFFDTGKVPDNDGNCGDPVAQTQALGSSLRISATPTLVFADGSVVPGAIPLAQIEKEMADADAETKKMAAAPK